MLQLFFLLFQERMTEGSKTEGVIRNIGTLAGAKTFELLCAKLSTRTTSSLGGKTCKGSKRDLKPVQRM